MGRNGELVRVLIVEDNEIDRMSMGDVLHRDGRFEVFFAPSFKIATNKLSEEHFDLVLLDYQLGDGTGLEVLETKPEAPVIFVTGSGDETIAAQAIKCGAYDYLTKDLEGGYLTMLCPTVENVLDRRRNERLLAESRARLTEIIETQPDVIFETDADFRLTFVSPVATEVLGRSPAALIGEPLATFAVEDERDGLERALAQIASGADEVRSHHCEHRREDGASRWLSLSMRPYTDDAGAFVGVRGSARDITDLRAAETALETTRAIVERTTGELADAKDRAFRMSGHLGERGDFEGLIGRHPVMRELYDKIKLAATADVAVHVTGPSGSGKELVAHAVHNLGKRHDAPFVVINCSAIPETLIEATLFGHVKGAFTGATGDSVGYVERAEGGTLFLDEIGDLSPMIQVKLLRLLQEQSYERVGESKPRTADVRIISATHHDLRQRVRSGEMREDFFYRIAVFPLIVPPLKDRRSDIPLLLEHFVSKIGDRLSKQITSVSPGVMEAFVGYDWPGNVRELENVLEYACVVCQSGVIDYADLPPQFGKAPGGRAAEACDTAEQLREVLERHDWNRTKAARALGISRVTLWKRMKAQGIEQES